MSKLTAQDIMHAEFKKTMRGYDTRQVDAFLDEVADTLQRVAQRTAQLEQTIINDKEKLAEYEKTQDLMQSTLLMAQKSAEARVEHARQEAKEIIAAAQEEARSITNSAFESKSKFDAQLGEIEKIRDNFVGEARGLLERFGKLLDDADKDSYRLQVADDRLLCPADGTEKGNDELRMKNEELGCDAEASHLNKDTGLCAVATQLAEKGLKREEGKETGEEKKPDFATVRTMTEEAEELELTYIEDDSDAAAEPRELTEEEKAAADLAAAEQESYADEKQSSLFGAFEQPRTATGKIQYAQSDELE